MSRKDIKVYNLPAEINSRTLADMRGSVFNAIENGFAIGFQFAEVNTISQSSGIGFFFKVLEELKIRGKKLFFLLGDDIHKVKSEDGIINRIDKILEYNKSQFVKLKEDEHEFILQGDINSTAVISIRNQCEEMVNSGTRLVFNINKAQSISGTSGMGFFLGILERVKSKNDSLRFIYDDKSYTISEEKEMLELCNLVNGVTDTPSESDIPPYNVKAKLDTPKEPIAVEEKAVVRDDTPEPVKSGNLEVDFEILDVIDDKQEPEIDEISIDNIEILETAEEIENSDKKTEAVLETESFIIEEEIEPAKLEEVKAESPENELVELTGEDLNRTLDEDAAVDVNKDIKTDTQADSELPAPRELPHDENFVDREEVVEFFEEFPEDTIQANEKTSEPVLVEEKEEIIEEELEKVEIEKPVKAESAAEKRDFLVDHDVVTPRVFSPIEKTDGFYDELVRDFDHLLEEHIEPELDVIIELNHIAVDEDGEERIEHVDDVNIESISTEEEIIEQSIDSAVVPNMDDNLPIIEEETPVTGLLEEPIIEDVLLEPVERVEIKMDEPVIMEEPVIIEEKPEPTEEVIDIDDIQIDENAVGLDSDIYDEITIDQSPEVGTVVQIEKEAAVQSDSYIEDTVELEIEERTEEDDLLDDDFIVEEEGNVLYGAMDELEAEEKSFIIEEELPEQTQEPVVQEIKPHPQEEEIQVIKTEEKQLIPQTEVQETKNAPEEKQQPEPLLRHEPEEKRSVPIQQEQKIEYKHITPPSTDSRYNARVEGGIINYSLPSDFYDEAPAKLSFLDGMQFEEEALFDVLNMVRYIHERKPVGLMKNSDYDSIMAEQQLKRYFKSNLEMKYFLEMSGESGFDMIAKRKSTGIEEVKLKFNKLDDRESVNDLINNAHHIVSDFDTFIIHIVQVPPETKNPIIEFAGTYSEYRFMKKRVGNYPFLISHHQYHNRGVFRIYHIFVNPIL